MDLCVFNFICVFVDSKQNVKQRMRYASVNQPKTVSMQSY